jgi:hypothetical protein
MCCSKMCCQFQTKNSNSYQTLSGSSSSNMDSKLVELSSWCIPLYTVVHLLFAKQLFAPFFIFIRISIDNP